MVKYCCCRRISFEILTDVQGFVDPRNEKSDFVMPSVYMQCCYSVTPEEYDRFLSSSNTNKCPANMSFLHAYNNSI
jgi:hypothetical protein